jgi:PIN domain nuclease of toxin-antitoxin system
VTAVLADTQAIVWWFTDDSRQLSEAAASALEGADAGDGIFVSAITLLDLWYATQKRERPITPEQLSILDDALVDPAVNVHVLPVTAVDARAAWAPSREELRDPFDRLILATARVRGLTLVTADLQLRRLGLVETVW